MCLCTFEIWIAAHPICDIVNARSFCLIRSKIVMSEVIVFSKFLPAWDQPDTRMLKKLAELLMNSPKVDDRCAMLSQQAEYSR